MSARDGRDVVLALPPSAPRMPRNRLAQWLGRSVLRLGGWRMAGEFPDLPKLVLIAAPHSSNWDGYWGIAAKLALGVRLSILGKHSLFRIPLLGPLLRWQGVIPVDRSSAHGTVQQAVELIRGSERIWYALAPEGTRKPVPKWKSGFLKIATEAGVPILMAYFHYPEKTIGIAGLYFPTGDAEADMAAIRARYRPWQGKHHGTD